MLFVNLQLLRLLLLLSIITKSYTATLTDQQKLEILEMHHKVRQGTYPSAANMNYLMWNTKLETLAQKAADKCKVAHNYGGEYAGLGENLYYGFRTNVTEIVQFWFSESILYNYSKGFCDKSSYSLNQCGHYWQSVGFKLTDIGCAMQFCATQTVHKDTILFCEYDSASPIYTAGEPCSLCKPPRSFCYRDQCVSAGMTTEIKKKDPSAKIECKVKCMNCATKSDDLKSGTCGCGCDQTRYSGHFCEKLTQGASHSKTCSVCNRLATPCLNGGTETSNFNDPTCTCRCTADFVGPQCQFGKSVFQNAVQMTLEPPELCTQSNKSKPKVCMGYPVNRYEFKNKIWPAIQSSIVSEINDFCSKLSNYPVCCNRKNTNYKEQGVKKYLTSSNLKYLEAETSTDHSGKLLTVLFAEMNFPNDLCGQDSGNKIVPQAVWLRNSLRKVISDAAKKCCGLDVSLPLNNWKQIAAKKYNIVEDLATTKNTVSRTIPADKNVSTSTTSKTNVTKSASMKNTKKTSTTITDALTKLHSKSIAATTTTKQSCSTISNRIVTMYLIVLAASMNCESLT